MMHVLLLYLLQVASINAYIASLRGSAGDPALHRPIPNEHLFANSTAQTNTTTDHSHATCESVPLRILPLDASITFGERSSNGNGYRKELQHLLTSAGLNTEMVGSFQSGNMRNNANEGHPGALVHEMFAFVQKNLTIQPDIITINVGTNDALRNSTSIPIAKVDDRMNALLDQLFQSFHDVTIVLSTLLPNEVPTADYNVRDIVNPKYREIVRGRRYEGQRIVLADMYEKVGMSGLSDDGTHSRDKGYKSMAHVWYEALMGAKKMFC